MTTASRRLQTAARISLGLIFFVFGLNGFLHVLPQPPMPAAAGAFAGALASAGYLFPLLKAVEVMAGALLLTGIWVPFALTLLAPIILNIVGFHLFLAPGNWAVVALVLASEVTLAWTHRAAFAPLFAGRERGTATAKSSLRPAHSQAA